MRKQDNPVVIFGVLTAAVFLIIAGWLFLPWFKEPSANPAVASHLTVKQDSLPCFLVVSDIHLHGNLVQSDISNRDADSGHDLWDTTQNKIKSVLAGNASYSKPTFMIVLGDLPWHTLGIVSADLENAHNNSGTVLHDLRTMAENAHVPLLYVSGNNDPWDGDYHPFSTKIFGQDTGCKTCWPLISPVQNDTTIARAQIIDSTQLSLGCYSSYPLGKQGGLRVIVLNTTMFVPKYSDNGHQQSNVTTQMAWFEAQLAQATAAKEAVLIAMHVPPGLDGYSKKDFWGDNLTYKGSKLQNAFLDLLEQNQNSIIGVLSSHTHMDGVRRLYGKSKKLVAFDISIPGIAPGHGNNPSVKLISYNPGNFSLQNFRTLYENYFPAQKVISWGNDQFDFRSEFGCPYGTSMRQYLEKADISTLQGAVQSIYKVKNGQGGTGEVNPALDVDYK